MEVSLILMGVIKMDRQGLGKVQEIHEKLSGNSEYACSLIV